MEIIMEKKKKKYKIKEDFSLKLNEFYQEVTKNRDNTVKKLKVKK